ncbi:MAG TPA: sigma-70 family RNA polymerase sigma factor [Ramlibacter sp.]|jgi:RNA polymerase sigma-70 factor (ECF subfamily)
MNPADIDLELIALITQVGERARDPALRNHSEAALRALYDRSSTKLYGLAVKVVRNRDWAEDVLQEAFLTIWRSSPDYHATLSPPMAWMGMIVRSRALDFLRRRTSERADTVQELDDVISETVAGDSPDPMDTTQASEQAWALHECLRKMEAKQREVVSLAYLRDLSHSELAGQLKLPLGTVKTWIRRGLDQLRGCMARFA